MSELRYRDGRPGDGAKLSELFCAMFAATFGHLYAEADLAAFLCKMDEDAFEGELADGAFAFRLAEADGRLAGYAKIGPNALPGEAPSGTLELYQLYVRSEWHGEGVAPKLMSWAMAEARQRGATHLALSVYVDNHRARRFYERYGFAEVGRYEFLVGKHVDDDRIMRVKL